MRFGSRLVSAALALPGAPFALPFLCAIVIPPPLGMDVTGKRQVILANVLAAGSAERDKQVLLGGERTWPGAGARTAAAACVASGAAGWKAAGRGRPGGGRGGPA